MTGEIYGTAADWAALFPEEPEPDEAALYAASRHIDSLTFGRITAAGGLDALTDFQRAAVREAACRQARFETENAGIYGFSMAAYSINGVSMKAAEGGGVRSAGGVAVPGDVYALLRQSGLCDRLLR